MCLNRTHRLLIKHHMYKLRVYGHRRWRRSPRQVSAIFLRFARPPMLSRPFWQNTCNELAYVQTQTPYVHDDKASCNLLLHTVTHCTTMQRKHNANASWALQYTATDCNRLQQTAIHCHALHHTAPHCKTMRMHRVHVHLYSWKHVLSTQWATAMIREFMKTYSLYTVMSRVHENIFSLHDEESSSWEHVLFI